MSVGLYLTFGERTGEPLVVFVGRQARVWVGWLVFSPLLIGLVHRWQGRGWSWPRQLLGHVAALGVLFAWFYLYFGYQLWGYQEKELSLWYALSDPARAWRAIREVAVFRELIFYFFLHFVVYLLIASLAYGLFWYRHWRHTQLEQARARAQLMEAQLANLHAQLQPHFLFNALNGIAGLVRQQRNDMAVEAIGDLGSLLRRSFQQQSQSWTTLDRELAFVEDYLRIERLRFQDRLKVHYDIGPGAASARLPVLVLQPLVENAVKHGVSRVNRMVNLRISARVERSQNLPAPYAGKSEVGSRKREVGSGKSETGDVPNLGRKNRLPKDGVLEEADCLVIIVEDDGPGLPAQPTEKGTGLSNLRARLDLLYGSGYELRLERPQGGGARVVLVVPVN